MSFSSLPCTLFSSSCLYSNLLRSVAGVQNFSNMLSNQEGKGAVEKCGHQVEQDGKFGQQKFLQEGNAS